MLAICLMLFHVYYSQNYASIIGSSLVIAFFYKEIQLVEIILQNIKFRREKDFGKFGKLQEMPEFSCPKFSFLKVLLTKLCFKTEQRTAILKIDGKFYRSDSSQLTSQYNTYKLLSYFCCKMFQPANNQELHLVGTRIELPGTDPKLPQVRIFDQLLQTISSWSFHSQLGILPSCMARSYFCTGALSFEV